MSADPNEHSKRSSDGSRRSVQEIFNLLRPSLDPIKPQDLSSQQELPLPASATDQATDRSLASELLDPIHGSVRSILRHPNTPGTGQNVRFFSRDAYRTISPDSSQEPEYQSLSPAFPKSSDFGSEAVIDPEDALASFFVGGPDASGPASSSTPAGAVLSRSASSPGSSKLRPSLSEVFASMDDEGQGAHDPGRPLDRPIPAPDFSSILDASRQMDDPSVPPGLGYDGDESAGSPSQADDDRDFSAIPNSASAPMTSAPLSLQIMDKGKERDSSEPKDQHSLLPSVFQERVFRPTENPPRPNPVHDRSHSFSFGQTVFFSVGSNSKSSNSSKSPASATSISPLTSIRPPFSESDSSESAASSTRLGKGRSRALSDTIFHRDSRAMSPTGGNPEADIIDESSPELFSAQQAEPDPFSAHAKTYYTPQTMIPTTPPQRQHVRRSSKEENIIFSLQTQLTLQTELCGQYEADLRARDELVEMLNNKMTEMDKEENRKKAVLRTWRKKVQELEKSVRYLEEELEDSRQESMERSVMDEASGEALRTLHRQIASLEREKAEWTKAERSFSELLQKKDENEREWQESLMEAKNRGFADEEEMRRLAVKVEQQKATDLERRRAAELEKADKGSMSGDLDTLRDQMKARDEEYSMLRAELEAQWQHTEKASEKLDALEMERAQSETEKETLRRELTTLEEKVASLEVEWQESEGRRSELESELQEVWNEKGTLEKERNQVSQAIILYHVIFAYVRYNSLRSSCSKSVSRWMS